MKPRIKIAGCLLLIGALGCASATPEARIMRDLQDFKDAQRRQDWRARLTIGRRMVRDNVQPFSVRILALSALGDYVSSFGATPEFDAEAKRYHAESLRLASSNEERSQAEYLMVLYYSKSHRNGDGLPYLMRVSKIYEQLGDEFEILKATFAISTAYNDMGEIALRDVYRLRALESAKVYFAKGRATPTEWVAYSKIIDAALGDFASRGEVDRIIATWKLIEPKYKDGTLRFASLKLMNVMEALALAGSADVAEGWVARTRAALERDIRNNPDVKTQLRSDFACHLAMVYLKGDRFEPAAKQFERCFALRAKMGIKSGLGESKNAGVVYERLGRYAEAKQSYRRAIGIAETLRAGYSVAERARIFRTLVRESYAGVARIAVRRFNQTKDPKYFREAIETIELVRGRQLGDLIGAQARVDAWRAPQGSVVISTLVTKEAVVVLADDGKTSVARLVDVDDIEVRARRIAQALSSPQTSKRRVYRDLEAVGRAVLTPVLGLLGDRVDVIALPDGVLNLVPFDLLIHPTTRAPLVETHAVRILPTLRMIDATPSPLTLANARLFAVGDPAYAQGPTIAGMTAEELTRSLRGSEYLSYFQRLPETRSEVETIARMMSKQSKAELLFGRKARESLVKSTDLTSFDVLHLATHGILGAEVPGVGEPALVLADEPNEDGFLTASEIEKLKLTARLTVLSACNTGSGELVQGEGVMGLSRSFLLAGSKAVVVSLWPVDSKTTEALMVDFYRRLRAGKSPVEALRGAKLQTRYGKQVSTRRQRGLRKKRRSKAVDASGEHPFYWAPFILVGE